MHLTARSSGARAAVVSCSLGSFLSSQTSPNPPCPIFSCLIHVSYFREDRRVRMSLWTVRPCWKVASSSRCRTSSGSSLVPVICNGWLVRSGDHVDPQRKADPSSCFADLNDRSTSLNYTCCNASVEIRSPLQLASGDLRISPCGLQICAAANTNHEALGQRRCMDVTHERRMRRCAPFPCLLAQRFPGVRA